MSFSNSKLGTLAYTEKLLHSLRNRSQEEPLLKEQADKTDKLLDLMKEHDANNSTIASIESLIRSIDLDQSACTLTYEIKQSISKWLGDNS